MTYRSAVVAGAGGFMGGHLVKNLVDDGYEVLAIDAQPINSWLRVDNDAESLSLDLEDWQNIKNFIYDGDEVYNLADNTGGVWYYDNNKTASLRASTVNLNLLKASRDYGASRYFFASSASVYPLKYQWWSKPRPLSESMVFPAQPEDAHGMAKLFGETACAEYHSSHGLETRVARYFNVYGPGCQWDDGQEGVVAAMCRKIAVASVLGDLQINVWGDGRQVRSFVYIDDAIDATRMLMDSRHHHPINIGDSQEYSVDEIISIIERFAKVRVKRNYDSSGPVGVRSRVCDSSLASELIGWKPRVSIEEGIERTYAWIYDKVCSRIG
jgi:GDP-D-mannose 3',5'-epimerase